MSGPLARANHDLPSKNKFISANPKEDNDSFPYTENVIISSNSIKIMMQPKTYCEKNEEICSHSKSEST